jgi:beta-galactosidase
VPDSIHAFRIRLLKEMGCNAYRCAHHPPAPELLDACDRLGMLVMDENRTFGSSPEHLAQLRAMVLRDRNHPSVILWSICNEEAIQGTPVAASIARAMTHEVKRLDPSRPVTAAVSGGILNDNCLADAMEVMGINYQLPTHDPYHAKHPRTPMFAAETHCVLATRGTYQTDADRHVFASHDAEVTAWGASARETWRHVRARPFLAGLFAWTGFDYRGEPTPHGWPCVNAQFGMLDTCGFPKAAFFLHKAFFTAEPFIHILPHWNWPGREGQPIRVKTYANADAAELLLNGESLGRKPVDPIEMAAWDVPFRPGVLTAVAFRAGRRIADARVETSGPAVGLGLELHPSTETETVPADGQFALPITVFAVDAQGRRVPDANDHVTFSLSGPAMILGVGNGDPTCHEPDKGSARSLFRGLAQVIVQTTGVPGTMTLTAAAPGRAAATLSLTSSAAAPRPSVPPARRRHFITDWRMSPIVEHRPDASESLIEQDVNTWDRVEPGQAQAAWRAAVGYALYRATFTPPKIVQSRGGDVLVHELTGIAEAFVNGSPAASKSAAAPGPISIPLPASASAVTLTLLVRAAVPMAGLTGRVELVPREPPPCAPSQNHYAK